MLTTKEKQEYFDIVESGIVNKYEGAFGDYDKDHAVLILKGMLSMAQSQIVIACDNFDGMYYDIIEDIKNAVTRRVDVKIFIREPEADIAPLQTTLGDEFLSSNVRYARSDDTLKFNYMAMDGVGYRIEYEKGKEVDFPDMDTPQNAYSCMYHPKKAGDATAGFLKRFENGLSF
jgi:hypothetical protein